MGGGGHFFFCLFLGIFVVVLLAFVILVMAAHYGVGNKRLEARVRFKKSQVNAHERRRLAKFERINKPPVALQRTLLERKRKNTRKPRCPCDTCEANNTEICTRCEQLHVRHWIPGIPKEHVSGLNKKILNENSKITTIR